MCAPEDSPFKSPLAIPLVVSNTQVHSNIQTRSKDNIKRVIDYKVDRATQTDDSFPQVSTRVSSESTLCNPNYLQAGLLMMAVGNQSSAQAVLNMYIMDTEVYKQKRGLPLRLEKKYQKLLNTVKKLKAVVASKEDSSHIDTAEIPLEEASENITEENADDANYDDTQNICIAAEVFKNEQDKQILEYAERYVKKMKEYNKKHLSKILPDPRSIREAHRVASAYLEGKVGKEMVNSGTSYLMPDGTSRAKVGRMGASIVHVGEKIRALKVQKMGNDTQANWVDTIIHQLNRLSNAADIPIKEIYSTIKGIISDACSVNKGLAVALSAKLGVEWIPGQLYCCIHTVLGFQSGIVIVDEVSSFSWV